MVTTNILLSTIEDVKEFVNLTNTFDFETDIIAGRYIIDAKSLMGIFSLDLSQPMQMELHTDAPQEALEKLQRFLPKG